MTVAKEQKDDSEEINPRFKKIITSHTERIESQLRKKDGIQFTPDAFEKFLNFILDFIDTLYGGSVRRARDDQVTQIAPVHVDSAREALRRTSKRGWAKHLLGFAGLLIGAGFQILYDLTRNSESFSIGWVWIAVSLMSFGAILYATGMYFSRNG